MEKIINPTKARTNLFSLIKNANRDSTPIIIAGADDNRSAVLIGKRDYDALQETMNLIVNCQIQAALSRKDDESVDLNEMMKEINNWKVTIKASAKDDLKRILKSPLRKSFEEIKMYWKLAHINQYGHLKN